MAEDLATRRRCVERIRSSGPRFPERRRERMKQHERHGVAAEKVAENIVEDLFTGVLDGELGDRNNPLGDADIVLTRLGIESLLLDVKRPGSLARDRRAADAAPGQARRYADEPKVKCIGVTDGLMLDAADIRDGGLADRVYSRLHEEEPPESLWWLSVHGIDRPRADRCDASLGPIPPVGVAVGPDGPSDPAVGGLLHPRYRIPAGCFAFVADASEPGTWKLPDRLADGSIDGKRLPKAIQAILSNDRGTKVRSIPEGAIADVLVRLGCAASSLGKMPGQAGEAASIYRQLAEALDQLGKIEEIRAG